MADNKEPVLEGMMAQLGDFGPYQLRQHLLHLMAAFLAGVHMLSLTFTDAIPEHRCFIPSIDEFNNQSISDLSMYIPTDKDGKLESCFKYSPDNGTEGCGGRYYYDPTYYPTSRTIDWDLVCDKRWMQALLQSIYMLGVLLGAVICGTLADKFGRKPIFYISAILQLIFGLACALMPHYYLYAVTLFFYGAFGSGGAYVTGFVLSMELVGLSKRTICGTAFSFSFALGVMLVAFWAWLIPNAQLLQIIYASHSLFLLGHWWLVDESIRWLWSKGHTKEAIEIVQKAVEVNGKYFVKHNSSEKIEAEESQSRATSISSDSTGEILKPSAHAGIVDLFRLPSLRYRMLIMAYGWFANSLVYYGLAFNIGALPGNPFFMSFLNGLAEIPAYLINVTLLDRLGRRTLESFLCFLGGFACIVVAFIPHGTLVITVSMLAKVFIASSFAICYNYTAELFPTSIRNSVVGITTMAARGAGMLAPSIILLDTFGHALPTLIFGSVAIISSFFSLFLPETLNKEMPQTIEDGENFGRGDTAFHTLWRCFKRRRLSNAQRQERLH